MKVAHCLLAEPLQGDCSKSFGHPKPYTGRAALVGDFGIGSGCLAEAHGPEDTCDMVMSQNWDPKTLYSLSWDPQNGTPHFWEIPTCFVGSVANNLARSGV